ncbi:MAG: DUF2892 domain-containing protein [Gammaproteobacteria bacterium]|nr:DUF2892 domain-containing protein [Gammaproteobacteria bacterium]
MKPNMGNADRIIRALVGLAAIGAWALGLLDGTLAIVSLVVGIVLLATAALRWCPPYTLLGINTGASRE